MAAERLTLVVSLFVDPGHETEFRTFEILAARVMQRYGGRIDHRIRIDHSVERNQPYEVHIVNFPDEESFQRYRDDPEMKARAELRARAIRETVLLFGTELPAFGAATN